MKARALALINYAAWSAEAEHGPQYTPADLHHEIKAAANSQRLAYRYSRALASIIDPETNESHTITRAELWQHAQNKGDNKNDQKITV